MKKNIIVVGLDNSNTVTGGALTIFTDFCNILSEHYNMIACISSPVNNRPWNLNENVEFANLNFLYPDKDYNKAFNMLMRKKNPVLVVFFFAFLYNRVDFKGKFKNIPKILMLHSRPDVYFYYKDILETLRGKYTNTVTQILLPSFYELLPDFIKKGDVVCIPNGIHTINELNNNVTENKKIIYLSRIDALKGHKFLIDSFALITHKYPHWKLDIYGQSEPPEYEDILKGYVTDLKLQNQIHFCGVTKTPIETLKNYDFCVFPSLFEGWGLGMTDAFCVGLPVIGIKYCSAVNELIIDGKNGLLADNDIYDFALKMEELINNKELRKKMSKEAYLSSLKYNKKDVYKKWLGVINAIIKEKEIPYKVCNTNNKSKLIFSIDYILKVKYKQVLDKIKEYKKFLKTNEELSKKNIYEYKILNFVSLLKIEKSKKFSQFKILGLPILKIEKTDNKHNEYFLFGIPLFKKTEYNRVNIRKAG